MLGWSSPGGETHAGTVCLDQHSERQAGYARDEHPAREQTACSRTGTRGLECAGWVHSAGSDDRYERSVLPRMSGMGTPRGKRLYGRAKRATRGSSDPTLPLDPRMTRLPDQGS
ncbi:hypothetical protein Bca52824_001464 [Brassica carinata]|uniref:Uncharacterized protein n=1 Tax=Brassica carinata TaxID=52824 RepID=A0A8X7WGB8_BRACI|nr:hypothetical protein Bca52824_001464 [Brassica carinata]